MKVVRESLNEELAAPQIYSAAQVALDKAKVPCKLKLMDDGKLVVELGWNYPDRLFDKVMNAVEKVGISYNQVDVCASEDGGRVINSCRIQGGPKRY